jgi:AmiR/NasT family two-component response regulator
MRNNGESASARIHQAQGIVSAQAECSLTDAMRLMVDSAQAADVTLEEVADEIIAGRVSYRPPPPSE